MEYAVHNVPSYQNLQGKPQAAHLGSQSHNGTAGAPEHNPGGYTQSAIGSGSPVKLEKGMPGMDM